MKNTTEKYRTAGFGEETKTVLFTHSELCLSKFKRGIGWNNAADNTPNMVQESLDRVSHSKMNWYVHEKHLTDRTDLHLIIDSPDLSYDDATGKYVEMTQYYLSKEHEVALQIDMSDITDGYYRVIAMYVPYVFDKADRINAVVDEFLTTPKNNGWDVASIRHPFQDIIDANNESDKNQLSSWRVLRPKF